MKANKKHAFYEPNSLELECSTIQYLVDTYTKEFLEQENQEPGKAYKMREIQRADDLFDSLTART